MDPIILPEGEITISAASEGVYHVQAGAVIIQATLEQLAQIESRCRSTLGTPGPVPTLAQGGTLRVTG